MKVLLCIAMLCASLCACDEDEIPNYLEGQLNDLYWRGAVEIDLLQNDTLTIIGVRDKHEEYVWARVKFDGVGTYQLTKNSGGFYSTIGRDVITTNYILKAGNVGSLTISEYDSDTGRLSGGILLMSLEEERGGAYNGYTTITFKASRFSAKLIRRDY